MVHGSLNVPVQAVEVSQDHVITQVVQIFLFQDLSCFFENYDLICI